MKRGTWFLLAVVAALVAFVLLWERKLPGTAEHEKAKGRLVPAALEKVRTLARTGTAPVTIVRRDEDRWDLTLPVADRADAYAVKGFLDRLTETEVIRWVDGASPDGLGLVPPRATWTVDAQGARTVLELGGPAPLGAGLYLRVDGRTALVPETVEETLLRPVADFRSKELLTIGSQDVDSFSFTDGGKERLSFRRDGGVWSVKAPFSDTGDSGALESILDDVCACPLSAVVEDGPKDLSRYGLEPPAREIRLRTRKGEVTLRLGNPVPGSDPAKALLYAFASDRPASVFSISWNSLKTLSGDFATLRSLSPFRRDPYDAKSLALSGALTLTLAPDSQGSWRTVAPPAGAKAEDGAALFSALVDLKGVRAEAADASSSAAPAYLTLLLRGEGWEERIDVEAEKDGRRFLHPAGRPVLLEVPKEEWQTVEATLAIASGKVPSAGAPKPTTPP